MPTQNLTCTECAAPLTLNEPVAPGKKIRCPKCKAIFLAPETAIAEAATAPRPNRDAAVEEAATTRRRSRDRERDDEDRDDDYDDRPARRRGRAVENAGMGAGAVIGIIAVCLLLIGAVGFGVFWGIRSWMESQQADEKAREAAVAAA